MLPFKSTASFLATIAIAKWKHTNTASHKMNFTQTTLHSDILTMVGLHVTGVGTSTDQSANQYYSDPFTKIEELSSAENTAKSW